MLRIHAEQSKSLSCYIDLYAADLYIMPSATDRSPPADSGRVELSRVYVYRRSLLQTGSTICQNLPRPGACSPGAKLIQSVGGNRPQCSHPIIYRSRLRHICALLSGCQ
jgi:hypothetical protein